MLVDALSPAVVFLRMVLVRDKTKTFREHTLAVFDEEVIPTNSEEESAVTVQVQLCYLLYYFPDSSTRVNPGFFGRQELEKRSHSP